MSAVFSKRGIEIQTIGWSAIAWGLCAIVSGWYLFAVRLDGDRWKTAISNDGIGYYIYLPAVFIYRDLDYTFTDNKTSEYEGLYSDAGKFAYPLNGDELVNKYYVGETLAQLPFFTIADQLTQTFKRPRDGYSFLYQAFFAAGAVFYLLLGLRMLRKWLLRRGFDEVVVATAIITLFFGTILFYYALEQPYMSHVYSFAFVAWFLNVLQRQLDRPIRSRLLLLAFLAGMIVILRPVNGILLLALFPLAGSKASLTRFFAFLFKHPGFVLAAILIVLFPVGVQSLLYYLQCGLWWVYSYSNESFNFLQPEIGNLLFSWRKGLFVYTPVLLLALPGFLVLRRKEGNFTAISLFLVLFVFTWIISSWWYWAYGGSLGMRAYVEAFPLLTLPLAALFKATFRYRWSALLSGIVLAGCIWLNLLQTWQSNRGILPYEHMSFFKYKRIFGKIDSQFAHMFPPDKTDETCIENPEKIIAGHRLHFDDSAEIRHKQAISNDSYKGSGSLKIGKQTDSGIYLYDVFLNTLDTGLSNLPLIVEISGMGKVEDPDFDAIFVLGLANNEKIYYWQPQSIIHGIHKANEWTPFTFCLQTSQLIAPSDQLFIRIYNENKAMLFLDNLKITIARQE